MLNSQFFKPAGTIAYKLEAGSGIFAIRMATRIAWRDFQIVRK